ncbi:MAG: FkbM family methyltransferase [Deltaproteobacteria bacterium]|nr:MAG: FkbM family methyltransferase [Deltaproteobacteria bacterium]
MKMPIFQIKSLRGKKWIASTGNHGCWIGSYEYSKRLLFEKTIRQGKIVFDIGAHVGFYTLLASALTGTYGKVFAFEPVPENLNCLNNHLLLNKVSNVKVFDAAVSDHCGTICFDDTPGSYMGHIAPQGKLRVKTVSIDELIGAGEIPVPDYLKIDVEGAEMLVLSGAKKMLADAHPIIFLATHGEEVHKQCCEFLNEMGYQLQSIGASAEEILAQYPK